MAIVRVYGNERLYGWGQVSARVALMTEVSG